MTTLEVLRCARAKIAEPEHWTKGAFARDDHGRALALPPDERAVSWCASGAIRMCGKQGGSLLAQRAIKNVIVEISHPCDSHSITAFNDDPSTTHADVLAVFDAAIEKLS